uniref:Uncharacterized protein n=1 Tax=Phaeomonas parva TaxID=124430 RepID=A0A7S1XVM0_9STRA
MGVDLEELWLRASGIGDVGLARLCQCLRDCPNLRVLILSECGISDAGLAALGRDLHHLVQLEHLDVSRNRFAEEGQRGFASSLASGPAPPRVKELIGIELNRYTTELGLPGEHAEAKAEQLFALLNGARLIQGQEIHVAPNRGPVDRIRGKFAKAATQDTFLVNLNFIDMQDPRVFGVVLEEIDAHRENLAELWLRGCALQDAAALQLAPRLKQCEKLEQLLLSENAIETNGVRALVLDLALCPRLRLLFLNHNRLGDGGLLCVGENLFRHGGLKELHVTGNTFSHEGERGFAKALASGPTPPKILTLTGVRLNRYVRDMGLPVGLGEASNADIFNFLNDWRGNQRSTVDKVQGAFAQRSGSSGKVNLNFADLSESDALTAVLEAIEKIGNEDERNLQDVWFRGCNLGDAGTRSVATALRGASGLREVVLSENRITDGSVIAVADSLGSWPNLAVLDLASNGFSDAGLLAIGRNMHLCPRLHTLSVNENVFSPDGVRAFAVALAEAPPPPALHELRGIRLNRHVRDMQLPPALDDTTNAEIMDALHNDLHRKKKRTSAQRIRRKVEKSEELSGLANLNFIKIDHEEALDMMRDEMARQGARLTEIWARGCGLGDEGIAAFAQHLRFCPNVKNLILSENAIGDDGLETLAEYLWCAPQLESLDISGNRFTPAGERAFAIAIARGESPPPPLKVLRGLDLTLYCGEIKMSRGEMSLAEAMDGAATNASIFAALHRAG